MTNANLRFHPVFALVGCLRRLKSQRRQSKRTFAASL
jgi:hypothetical protein